MLRRIHLPGGTVFFTVRLAVPGSWLLVEEIDLLRFAVGKTLGERPVEVLGWTVLPDQMHAVWRLPAGDSAYGLRWAAIKGRFSSGLSSAGAGPVRRRGVRATRGEVGIWQKRFWEHHIRGSDDLRLHLELCRMAPVEAGLVSQHRDWPFSSFSRKGRGASPAQQTVSDSR